MADDQNSARPRSRRRLLIWLGGAFLALLIVLVVAGFVVAQHAAPILKARVIQTLRASFHSRVELADLDVVFWRGFAVTGGGLKIYASETVPAAEPAVPLIALQRFEFHASLPGLFLKPTHVGAVKVEGLEIDIPPRGSRPRFPTGATGAVAENNSGKREIVVDEIVCENSQLVIRSANPDKDPKTFLLRHIELHNVGPDSPWRYRATLTNAIPRGDIQASGNFGPWQSDSPGDSTVTGHYIFQHADLSTINGIGGMLSSTGDFAGKLNRMTVDGTTNTPDFSLLTANQPVPLQTRFHAIVDGLTGDTYLQPVQATLMNSAFTASGSVIDIKGKGHIIDIDIDIPAGRLQDFLSLAVETRPPVLNAVIRTKAKLHIPPGKAKVAQKLNIQGRFTLSDMHFTNPEVQDKVDMLSFRARGEPEKARPGAQDVKSGMTGIFVLQRGTIDFQRLAYSLPGAQVHLAGSYSLDGQVFDFNGHVFTQVRLYRMVDSRWASLALRAVSPFFRSKDGGADIPVTISGTRSAPKFGLDVLKRNTPPDRGP